MMHRWTTLLLVLVVPRALFSQDSVTFRERGGAIQTVKGKIESDSLAGLKIAGRTIPAGDVVDVQYETPGSIRLDLPKAIQAETAGKSEEAAKEYRALASVPAVTNNKSLKRFFDYKAAWNSAARSENNSEALQEAIVALAKFIQAHPDGWERIPVTRLLTRLYLDERPPNFEAARKTYDDLAQTPGTTAETKIECGFMIVELLMAQKKTDDARKALTTIPASDPRVAVWQIGLDATPANVDATVKRLEGLLDNSDDGLKATIYNALGDCYRLDPKRRKDALFAYLWVDVVYNQDAMETAKAQDRLSELFREMKDDDRAKLYRNKARRR